MRNENTKGGKDVFAEIRVAGSVKDTCSFFVLSDVTVGLSEVYSKTKPVQKSE